MSFKLPSLPKVSASVSFKAPRITLGDKDRGALLGSTFGPFGAAAGYKYGDKLGNWFQSRWEDVTGKTSRQNQENAAKEAERLRRESIVKEMGARQQAEQMAFAGLQRDGGNGGSSSAPGVVGSQDAPGSIAANISSSGTF